MTVNTDIQLYPLMRVAIMLILGMLLSPLLPSIIFWVAAFAVPLVVALLFGRHPMVQSVAISLAFCGLGGWLMSHAEDTSRRNLPKAEVGYEAVLMSEPVPHGKVVQCDLMVLNGDHPFKVKASILRDTIDKRYTHLHVGDGIRARSLLQQPSNYRKSSFDYARWLRYHGYRAQTFIFYSNWTKARVPLASLSWTDLLRLRAQKLRKQLLSRLSEYEFDGATMSVVSAMVLGDKTQLSHELRDNYSVAGVSHVLALSGLHLGIIYSLLMLLTLGRPYHIHAQLLVVTGIWCYVFMVGMSPSVVRSAIMLSVYSLVSILDRNKLSLNTLSLAAIAMLVANPFNLYDVGFQLSFMSVAAILVFVPLFEEYFSKLHLPDNVVVKWIAATLMVSVAAQIGTAPLVAYHFGRFSCYFFLTNFVAVPATIVIISSTALFLCLSSWHTLQSYAATVIQHVASWLNDFVTWTASLPGASIDGLSPSVWGVTIIYLFFAFVYYLLYRLLVKINNPMPKPPTSWQ